MNDVVEILRDNTDIFCFVRDHLPYRPDDAHKGTMGTMVNISGSYSMAGACVLSSLAALRSGVGLLKIVLPQSIYPIVASTVYEAVFMPVKDGASGTITTSSMNALLDCAQDASSVLIGCGLKNTSDTREFVGEFVPKCKSGLVIDADGINALSQNIDILKERKGVTVMTPHLKEMSRLCGLEVSYIAEHLIDTAVSFAKKYDVCVVLKGSRVVITDGSRVVVRPTGNSGMAKGGSGDVLSGIIASLMAQGCPAFESAVCGVYIHRMAGDIAAQRLSKYAMLPRDMVDSIADVFKNLTQ